MSEIDGNRKQDFMWKIERLILQMKSRRQIVQIMYDDHGIHKEDTMKIYMEVVEEIAKDEYCLDEDQERAIRMASLRKDIEQAEMAGDTNQKIKIKREFAETRNIISPRQVKVSLENFEQKTEGELLASVLADMEFDEEEKEVSDEPVEIDD